MASRQTKSLIPVLFILKTLEKKTQEVSIQCKNWFSKV